MSDFLSSGDVVAALRDALGDDCVSTGDAIGARHFTSYGETPGPRPRALLRPRGVDDVSRALAICTAYRQTVVPQGGMTGLAAGAAPAAGDVALSLERLTGVVEIDAEAATVTAWAGTTLQALQQAVDEAGFALGIDLGARGSCQIGGNVATNAGGNRVIRYGTTREQVLGLEVVLADGAVLGSLNKLLKNNAGYDLRQIFVGSEGTLGIVTRVVLRLHPKLAMPSTALCAVRDTAAALALLRDARASCADLLSFETMWPAFYDHVARHTPGVRAPLPADGGVKVLIECAGAGGDAARTAGRFEAVLAGWLERGLIDDAALAQSAADAQAFWTLREGLAIDALPGLVNFDVGIAPRETAAFIDACERALTARWPGAHVFFFGHLGDSNLHVCVSAPYAAGEGAHDVDAVLYPLVRDAGGSVSAEHGIGRHKRDWLGCSRSDAELAAMRRLKHAFDPLGLLNPGKVL
ncbi:FAD-linked oxidase [Burkholderia sp. MSh2]|uniref:FAD linked oxidase domain-containing protein n=1 Tax=Burkholderia paludis TaxID=1506587 RepID=A0A6J5F7P2_9BURK|nr:MULTISPECIES: FAD-binding oxidoreductase [Burkholderia]KEZ01064.1 FAD-linked oxidase [Burkholderia sp. MSh2]CAB3773811.1 putative FAD-linked oxidoreductase [Burkholderia paludis]VWB12601.1 FAD linked oxidase domain-containing protein [Burkholderia paludis]